MLRQLSIGFYTPWSDRHLTLHYYTQGEPSGERCWSEAHPGGGYKKQVKGGPGECPC